MAAENKPATPKKSAAEVYAQIDALRNVIKVLAGSNPAEFLTRYAAEHGAENSTTAAAILGIDSRSWEEQRRQREKDVIQSRTIRKLATEPREDPRYIAQVQRTSPLATNEEISALERRIKAEYDSDFKPVGPVSLPGTGFKDHAPVQTSRMSTTVKFNAEEEADPFAGDPFASIGTHKMRTSEDQTYIKAFSQSGVSTPKPVSKPGAVSAPPMAASDPDDPYSTTGSE